MLIAHASLHSTAAEKQSLELSSASLIYIWNFGQYFVSPTGGRSGHLGEFTLLPLQKFEVRFPLGTEQFLETFQHCLVLRP